MLYDEYAKLCPTVLQASRVSLGILVQTFGTTGTIVLGLDETIERRCGAKIKGKGICRDPIRSSHSHFAKTSGLRWQSVLLLAARAKGVRSK